MMLVPNRSKHMNLKDLEFSLSRLADASVFGDTQRDYRFCREAKNHS